MWAKCRACGLVFPFRAISIGGSAIVSMGGTRTNCSRSSCGGTADIFDGEYHSEGGALREIRNLSAENAQLLLSLLRGAWRNPPQTENARSELAQQIAAVSPPTAAFLAKAGFSVSVLALILTILAFLAQLRADADTSAHEDEMLKVSQRLVEIAEQDASRLDVLAEALAGLAEASDVQPLQLERLLEEILPSSHSKADTEVLSEEPLSKRQQRRLRGKLKGHRWESGATD